MVAIGTAAAAAGLVVGLGLVLLSSDDRGAADDPASMAEVSAADMDEGRSTPAASDSASAPTELPNDAPDTTAGSPLDACVRAVAHDDAAVEAARTSLGNWKAHYGAQIAFDRGEIDGDEAKRRWAVSKEFAQRDIDAFVTAREAMPDDDPCTNVPVDQLGSGAQRLARRCAARASAALAAVAATEPTLKDWRTHLRMMDTKDDYPIEEYLEIWRQTVADAPGPMRDFEAAVAALDDTADCGGGQDAALQATPVLVERTAAVTPAEAGIVCVLARVPAGPAPAPV